MTDNPYAAPATDDPTPPASSPALASPYGPYRPLAALRITLLALFGLGILAAVAQIFVLSSLNQINEIDLQAGTYSDEADLWVDHSNTLGSLESLTFIITAIVWCIWTNKACKNAWLFRPAPTSRIMITSDAPTPGWAVGSYFIPILNLYKPFQAMAFIRDQVTSKVDLGPLLGLWWTGWLITNGASSYFSRNYDSLETTAEAIVYNRGIMIDSGITIMASILAAMVIDRLTRGQQALARERGLILG